jgi:hypothetical protein
MARHALKHMLHVGYVPLEASLAALEIAFDAGDLGPSSSIVLLDADGALFWLFVVDKLGS